MVDPSRTVSTHLSRILFDCCFCAYSHIQLALSYTCLSLRVSLVSSLPSLRPFFVVRSFPLACSPGVFVRESREFSVITTSRSYNNIVLYYKNVSRTTCIARYGVRDSKTGSTYTSYILRLPSTELSRIRIRTDALVVCYKRYHLVSGVNRSSW